MQRGMANSTPAGGVSTDPAAAGPIAPDAANTSGVTGEVLESKLKETLGAEHVRVEDISGEWC